MSNTSNNEGRLAKFIREQQTARGMSARAFADFCNVSYETINKMLRNEYGQESGEYPTIPILVKIAAATNVTPESLLSLLLPKELSPASADATRLALLISRMSPDDRRLIEDFINGALLRASQQAPNDQE